MTDTATSPPQRWRGLTAEEKTAQRARERQGDILSRLRGVRYLEQPRPGFWLMRAVKGGPEVPASIQWERTEFEPGEPDNRMDRSPILTARLGDRVVSLDRVWNWSKRAISKAEYEYRKADAAWAAVHAPQEPAANPHKKIDHMTVPLPF